MRDEVDRQVFFLGGHDLEMVTIKELLDEKKIPYYDKCLLWGAKASNYEDEINQVIASGRTPVLVELTDDLDLSQKNCMIIDHHGEKAGIDKPGTFRQVFALLQLPSEQWTRWFELVDANDKGHIQALINIGASQDEIVKVREADRRTQGITLEQESQGRIAADLAKIMLNCNLTVVELPHPKTAVVTDLLHPALGGSGYENLLVISPGEVNFYGKGAIVIELSRKFPDGWYGGSLPEYGFWGHSSPKSDVVEFISMIISRDG